VSMLAVSLCLSISLSVSLSISLYICLECSQGLNICCVVDYFCQDLFISAGKSINAVIVFLSVCLSVHTVYVSVGCKPCSNL